VNRKEYRSHPPCSIDKFIPPEEQQRTDIICRASKDLKRSFSIQGSGRNVVDQEIHVHEAQQPKVGGGTGPIKNGVGNKLQHLIPVVTRLLVLLVWLTLPIGDAEGTENILDLFADLNLRAIADQFCQSSMATKIILKGINKLLFRFHALNVSNVEPSTHKNLGSGLPTIDSGCVGIDRVGGNRLIMAVNIESGVGRFVSLLENSAHGHASVLWCRDLKRALDDISGHPTKEGMKPLVLGWLGRNQTRRRRQGAVMNKEVRTTGMINNVVHIVIKHIGSIKEREN
jgi:hypothetical protein